MKQRTLSGKNSIFIIVLRLKEMEIEMPFDFDDYIWRGLAGPHNIQIRQDILSHILGKKEPKAKCGITRIKKIFHSTDISVFRALPE